jgi:hypothetical protein
MKESEFVNFISRFFLKGKQDVTSFGIDKRSQKFEGNLNVANELNFKQRRV